MAGDVGVFDIQDERNESFVGKVALVAMIHREAMDYLYKGDAGYARMFSLMGIPQTRPVFQVGRTYLGTSSAVLEAAVHNATLTTRTFTGDPEKLPLTTMVVGKYKEMTSKENLDA